MPLIDTVQYFGRDWYTRVREEGKRDVHWGPWKSQVAAAILRDILYRRYRLDPNWDWRKPW